MSSRTTFGPPRNPFGAFAWAVVQLPRALVWLVREPELRALTFVPALVTFGLGFLLSVVAVASAGPLQELLLDRAAGAFGAVTWLVTRVVLTAVLVIGALLMSASRRRSVAT